MYHRHPSPGFGTPIEADDQAETDQLIGAHAGDVREILDAFRVRRTEREHDNQPQWPEFPTAAHD